MITILKKICHTAALSLYKCNNLTLKDSLYFETGPWSEYECQCHGFLDRQDTSSHVIDDVG